MHSEDGRRINFLGEFCVVCVAKAGCCVVFECFTASCPDVGTCATQAIPRPGDSYACSGNDTSLAVVYRIQNLLPHGRPWPCAAWTGIERTLRIVSLWPPHTLCDHTVFVNRLSVG
jgi:hypothetical protein